MLLNTRGVATALMVGLVLGVCACGDDGSGEPSFAGTYQVISHTRNTQSCEAEGDAFDGDDYFKLVLDDSGAQSELGYRACSKADDCVETTNQTKSFDEKNGDAWKKLLVSATPNGSDCEIRLTERVATMSSGDVRIEERVLEGTVTPQDSQNCDKQFAPTQRDQLDCTRFDVIVAVRTQ